MARVPITVMGCRCEQCSHEWIPPDPAKEPAICPACESPSWNHPPSHGNAVLTYEAFRDAIQHALGRSGPLTWTEIRTIAKLPQKFPNNRWVHQMEREIGLIRAKDEHGIFKWQIG